jgi:hypothetical protein
MYASVLMGIGEAGYYVCRSVLQCFSFYTDFDQAGMIYYLSFWYRKAELALRISLCMTGTLPGAIGVSRVLGILEAGS